MNVVTVCPSCESPAEAEHGICPACRLPIDERFDSLDKELKEIFGERYEIVCRLGAGSAGEVFRARDIALDREVALKLVLANRFTDADQAEEMKQRTFREAKMAERLVHPNVVTVYDTVQLVDGTAIIMQFVEGASLESLLSERRRLSFDETLELMSQTAAALDYAHELGIAHLDIKPANLLIDGRGEIRIADFGVAKLRPGRGITGMGNEAGTPYYMSPEQACGHDVVDGLADLFSLGCVAYECLSGQKPFEGNTAIEILLQIMTGAPPVLDCDGLGLHRNIQTVFDRALATDAPERFVTAAEFIGALRAIPVRRKSESVGLAAAASAALKQGPSLLVTRRAPGSTRSFEKDLQGKLSDQGLAATIQNIHGSGKTGILHLQKDDVSKRLYFLGGSIVFANSDLESDRLGQFLIRGGVIDEATYESAWRATKKTGRRLGATLVELGNLDREKMDSVINKQVEEIIFSVFSWDDGRYRFETIDPPVEEDIALELSIAEIILKGARRTVSVETIRQAIGSTDRVAQHASSVLAVDRRGALTSDEDLVLSGVDGSTSVADLVARSSLSETEALRCVYGLSASGILRLDASPIEATTHAPHETDQSLALAPVAAEVRDPSASADRAKRSSNTPVDLEEFVQEVIHKIYSAGEASHYELLEVARDASKAEIKKSYGKLVKKFHPDRHRRQRVPEIQPALEKLLVQLTAAYEELGDPVQRTKYDAQLKPRPSKDSSDGEEVADSAGPISVPSTGKSPDAKVTPAAAAAARKRYLAARVHFNKRDYHRAVQCLRECVRLVPDKAKYHNLLGQTMAKNPYWRKQTEHHFERVVELAPSVVDGYLGLAQLYEECRLTTRAMKMYKKVLELEPGHYIASIKLGANTSTLDQLFAKTGFLKQFRRKG